MAHAMRETETHQRDSSGGDKIIDVAGDEAAAVLRAWDPFWPCGTTLAIISGRDHPRPPYEYRHPGAASAVSAQKPR
jgi:hypothetical protein